MLGAHLSTNGGYYKAAGKAADLGANVLQIFSCSPRGWNKPEATRDEISLFNKGINDFHIARCYFHASYLINLADSSSVGHNSKKSLIAELTFAPQLGVRGSIVHLGSYKKDQNDGKYQTLIANIKDILENTPPETLFIMENAGTRKIGQTIEELGKILQDVSYARIRVCLDTCHLHSAGYDISTKEKLDGFISMFDRIIGLNRLELWHVNDSRDPFGALRDRHENIGKGTLPLDTFRLLLNHPKLKHLPFIIETPGFDGKGPDRQNMNILKSLI